MDKIVTLDVPELTQLEAMVGVIDEPGHITTYTEDLSKKITLTEFYAALGYSDNSKTSKINSWSSRFSFRW